MITLLEVARCAKAAYEKADVPEEFRVVSTFDDGLCEAVLLGRDDLRVVSVRGTDELKDWVDNASFMALTKMGEYRVQRGYHWRAIKLLHWLHGLDKVQVITGHSLGASVGLILNAAYAGPSVAMPFSPPHCYKGPVPFLRAVSIIDPSDIVPKLPLSREWRIPGAIFSLPYERSRWSDAHDMENMIKRIESGPFADLRFFDVGGQLRVNRHVRHRDQIETGARFFENDRDAVEWAEQFAKQI
jgi:hypothetical protein